MITTAIEIFSGTKSFTQVAKKHGIVSLTFDNNLDCNPDVCADILDLYELPPVDIVWASPPCTAFSVASIGKHWDKDTKLPKSYEAKKGIEVLRHTIWLISKKPGVIWYIENPRGMMRNVIDDIFLEFGVKHYARREVCYCQYGDSRMKPTDIWTNNTVWKPRVMCKNNNPNCNHQRAPRGSRTGTQGLKNNIERGKIPSALFEEIFNHVEKFVGVRNE